MMIDIGTKGIRRQTLRAPSFCKPVNGDFRGRNFWHPAGADLDCRSMQTRGINKNIIMDWPRLGRGDSAMGLANRQSVRRAVQEWEGYVF